LTANKFPCVVKVGHAHGGLGKMKVENNQDFQEVASVVALTGSYCVVEPLVDTRCDLHVQKIGTSYKAFVRKSISGNWKANIGSAILEQVPMTERYKQWVDAVSELFGGLDICAVEAIQGKDGREYITEANDSAMQLLGETQEEDRRLIAELVLQRMQQYCRPPGTAPPKLTPQVAPLSSVPHCQRGRRRRDRASSVPQSVGGPPSGPPPGPPPQPRGPMPTDPQRLQRGSSGAGNPPPPPQRPQGGPASLFRRESQSSEKSEDPDDTMRNLRKTFAGIFGDM
ncbi:synapsin, putative, partial [Ixodes scapularis]